MASHPRDRVLPPAVVAWSAREPDDPDSIRGKEFPVTIRQLSRTPSLAPRLVDQFADFLGHPTDTPCGMSRVATGLVSCQGRVWKERPRGVGGPVAVICGAMSS